MKLSKKIKFVQLASLIIAITICLLFTLRFNNRTLEGDITRVSEISKGVRVGYSYKINELNKQIDIYENLINKFGINYIISLDDNDKLKNPFNLDGIFFSGIYNLNNKTTSSFMSRNLYNIGVMEELQDIISSSSLDSLTEVVQVEDIYYILSYKKINNNQMIVLIQEVNNSFLKELESFTESIVFFTRNPQIEKEDRRDKIDGVEVITASNKKEIYTYSQVTSSTNDIYLVVQQEKEVYFSLLKNFNSFSIFLFALIILGNFLVYTIINKIIIRRISRINECVYKISGEEDYSARIEEDGMKDEISNLSLSLNSMLDRVEIAKNKIRYSEKKYHNIINSMTNGFIFLKSIYDDEGNIIDGEILDMNIAAKHMLRINKFDSMRVMNLLKNNRQLATNILLNLCKLKNNSQYIVENEVELSNNTWGMITLNAISINNFFIIINDVTKIKMYSEQMEYFATYDTLTRIYNRRKIIDYVTELKKHKRSFSFFFIDLDNFKKLNDTLGHDEGDKLLQAVSKSFEEIIDSNIKIGRFGGDEFVLINEGDNNEKSLQKFAMNILNSINKKYVFDKFTYNLEASIGVASFPQDSDDINEIIKYADIAMYYSKTHGKNKVSLFNKEMLEAHELENKIKDALKNNKFEAYFQPIYNIDDKIIDSVEALVRWSDNNKVISPESFISVARRANVLDRIDKTVILEACKFNKRVHDELGYYITVSVNVSNSLLTRKDFVDFIFECIDNYKIPAKYINIEITEEEIIDDTNYIVTVLNHLRRFGMKVSLDDFGTGYSTYSYVNLLPLDTMKIDKSLIEGIEKVEKNYSIVKSLIELSKSLDLDITCEGVENKEQLCILSNLGCKRIQGYLFSRPKSIDDAVEYIKEINSNLVNKI